MSLNKAKTTEKLIDMIIPITINEKAKIYLLNTMSFLVIGIAKAYLSHFAISSKEKDEMGIIINNSMSIILITLESSKEKANMV